VFSTASIVEVSFLKERYRMNKLKTMVLMVILALMLVFVGWKKVRGHPIVLLSRGKCLRNRLLTMLNYPTRPRVVIMRQGDAKAAEAVLCWNPSPVIASGIAEQREEIVELGSIESGRSPRGD